MSMELDETITPATTTRKGTIEYQLEPGDKVHLRSKDEPADWVNDLQFVAPAGKTTRVVVVVYVEEV